MLDISFKEIQHPPRKMLRILIETFFIFIILFIVNYFVIDSYKLFVFLLPLTIVTGVFLLLSATIRLNVMVDNDGIHYRFLPFHLRDKFIPYKEIEIIKIDKLKVPFRYYGFRAKVSLKKSMYLVGGYDALVIKKKDGRLLILGTKKKREVLELLSGHPKVRVK